jgi:hypothetical protein
MKNKLQCKNLCEIMCKNFCVLSQKNKNILRKYFPHDLIMVTIKFKFYGPSRIYAWFHQLKCKLSLLYSFNLKASESIKLFLHPLHVVMSSRSTNFFFLQHWKTFFMEGIKFQHQRFCSINGEWHEERKTLINENYKLNKI